MIKPIYILKTPVGAPRVDEAGIQKATLFAAECRSSVLHRRQLESLWCHSYSKGAS